MVSSLIRRTMTRFWSRCIHQTLLSILLEKILAWAESQYARVLQIDRGSESFEELSVIDTLFMSRAGLLFLLAMRFRPCICSVAQKIDFFITSDNYCMFKTLTNIK